MPSHANPALRALRRLAARDPEVPLRLEAGGARAVVASVARSAGVAIADPFAELLAGKQAPAATADVAGDATAGAAAEAAAPPPNADADAKPRRRAFAGRLGSPFEVLARHRRVVSLSACVLIVAVAAVGALPAVSVAGEPVASGPVAGVDTGQADNGGAAQSPDLPVYDENDGTIYNTIQSGQSGDQPPTGGAFQWYTVQGGDGLNKIAAKFGLHANTIYWANKSRLPNLSSISIGLRLLIPPVDGVVVSVKSGVSLSSLAQKYRVSVQAIMIANGLPSESITAGQLLVIPGSAPAIPGTTSGCTSNCGGSTYNGGKLRWPVVGYFSISQYFSSSHPAIDLAAATGTPVVAAAAGKVIFAGWKTSGAGYGGGLVVWINHNGKLYTTYNHLSAEFVSVGQTVAAGQRLGNVGMTGNATGPHLHFEVWVCFPWTGGNTSCARNPLRYLP